jgi:hypothetical protein
VPYLRRPPGMTADASGPRIAVCPGQSGFPGRTWCAVDAFHRTLTGRFGVRVPGGAPTHENRPLLPVLDVSGCRRDPRRLLQHTALPIGCLPPRPAAYRRRRRASRRGQVGAVRRIRARRGTCTITARGGRLQAQVSLGTESSGRCVRRSRTFDSRSQAEVWPRPLLFGCLTGSCGQHPAPRPAGVSGGRSARGRGRRPVRGPVRSVPSRGQPGPHVSAPSVGTTRAPPASR